MLIVLVFIIVPIVIGLALYFIPKKLGYPKVGKVLIITYFIAIASIVIYAMNEDRFFTENDAKELIEEQDIKLNDEFDLVENYSSWAIGDYYHSFTIRVSAKDWKNAKKTISEAHDFKPQNDTIQSLIYKNINRYEGAKVVQDYESHDDFIREYFQPSGQEGYAPTFRRISVSKTENIIIFEDIDD